VLETVSAAEEEDPIVFWPKARATKLVALLIWPKDHAGGNEQGDSKLEDGVEVGLPHPSALAVGSCTPCCRCQKVLLRLSLPLLLRLAAE